MCARAELQPPLVVNAIFVKLAQLVKQRRNINDCAISHKVDTFFVKDSAREQVERVLVSISVHAMTRIGTTVETSAQIEVFRKNIDKLSLALISPLTA